MQIAKKISLSFLVTAVVLALGTFFLVYNIEKKNLEKLIFNHLITTARSRVNHIKTFLEMEKNNIIQLSKSISFEGLLAMKSQNPNYPEAFDRSMTSLRQTKEAFETIYEVFILDKNGRIIASSDKTKIGLDKSMDAYFSGAKEDVYVTEVYYSQATGFKSIDFSAPIRDDRTKEFLGVVVMKTRLDPLYKITLDRTGLGQTGEIYLINKHGYMITPSRFTEDTFLKLKIDTENSRRGLLHLKNGLVHCEHATFIFPDYRNRIALGVHEAIPETKWILLAEFDKSEALAPLYKMRVLFSILVFIIPLLAYLIGIFVSRLITKPIHNLHVGTEIIGKGNLDYKVGTAAQDEIGQLSRAFDKMTNDLENTTTSIDKLNKEVAQRKKAEEKVRQTAEEWEKTFNAISDFVFIIDKDYTLIRINKAFAEAFKLKPEDIIGKKCYELVHKRNSYWPDCPFEKTKLDKKFHNQVIEDPNLGIPLFVSISPILDDKGEVVEAVHIAKDISELKEAEKKTKEAIEMKSQFISMVSHELRTPLTAIKEGIGIVEDGTAGKIKKEQKEFLSIAKRNVDRLGRLINDVLDFQKLEYGKAELYMKENDINEAVKEVHRAMLSLAKEKDLNFSVKLDTSLPKIKFDKDKIIQVLTNLTNNAIKFTEKGEVAISSKKNKNLVQVSVQDTGPGINKDDMTKLFHSFGQLEKNKNRKTGGSGLGLVISKGIIERHNGKIWAESESGKGTVFHFTLPV